MKIRSRSSNWLFWAGIAVVAMSWIQGRQTIVSSAGQTRETIEYGLPLPWLIHDSVTGWGLSLLSLLGTFLICVCVVAMVSLLNKKRQSNGTTGDVPTSG
ncbi:MAG TPA: hypothetical protein ENI27_02455 [bacterium]|nr:hypothetical protein [bacterium]